MYRRSTLAFSLFGLELCCCWNHWQARKLNYCLADYSCTIHCFAYRYLDTDDFNIKKSKPKMKTSSAKIGVAKFKVNLLLPTFHFPAKPSYKYQLLNNSRRHLQKISAERAVNLLTFESFLWQAKSVELLREETNTRSSAHWSYHEYVHGSSITLFWKQTNARCFI